MSSAKEAVFGSWKSPISSKLATESSVGFQEVHVDKGNVYWTEMRYDEAGRYVVCTISDDQGVISWTPADYSARTLVHEYGGGASLVHDGVLYFSNFSDQKIYKQTSAEDTPTPLTQEGWRFADAEYQTKFELMFCVREDHTKVDGKTVKEPENTVVCVDPTTGACNVLVSGSDFYSSPRVSPDGKKMAWMEWKHPNMPWDTTEIYTAELAEDGRSIVENSKQKVCGGDNVSVMCPRWTADNQLLYIGDQTDWWNLYMLTEEGEHVNLCPMEKEIGGPHWTFAHYPYAFDPRGTGLIATNFGGELGLLNLTTREYSVLDTGYKSHSYLQFSENGRIYCVAGGPTKFSALISVDAKSGQVEIIRKSRSVPIDDGYFSVPRKVTWPTTGDEVAHGFFYPPTNKDFTAPEGTRPPLLVKIHGGPTSQTSSTLNLKIQYFTSRGFSVLDVDYRGSTGYGKAYRHRLRGEWGVCDVDDASTGAKYLAEQGEADAERLCIDGGSAGGYTTLACLAFTDAFKAGASHYGIGDLEALAAETHKFESRYCDTMIAPFTPENKHIYEKRSPIKHIENFNCPIAFFQGDEDKIVPPNQAEMMFDAVKAKGLPCALVMFQGEQHGFRKAENVQKALDGEFYFFSKVFKFEPADQNIEIDVCNLPQ